MFLCGCTISEKIVEKKAPNPAFVRIAVLKGVEKCTLEVRGPSDVVELKTEKIIGQPSQLADEGIVAVPEGIQMGAQKYLVKEIQIRPREDGSIYVNSRCFRGKMNIINPDGKSLLIVNVLEIEQYIRGVLYHEVSDRWPNEAIKAQAVAARTYAFYSLGNSRNKYYDVTSDIYSQVYGGQTSERYRTNLAVERTLGLVLAYEGKILPAYYHATCGGHTENVSEVWKATLAPLSGVACPFCKGAPHAFWKKNSQLKTIQDALNAKGYALGLIKEIRVEERNDTGRIRKLKIITRDDKEVILSGKEFRDIVGPNVIKSNNYAITMKGYYVDFFGKGWGHGVGMCQWGTHFMAKEGHDFRSILQFYYPGAEIVSQDSLSGESR